jgi:hypothetical protein
MEMGAALKHKKYWKILWRDLHNLWNILYGISSIVHLGLLDLKEKSLAVNVTPS